MENKDRLDEFLQRKFAEDQPEQRLAFREEHWLQAQALIEARERKRRRGFWWWWMGAGLLALLLAGWWFFAEGGLLPQRFAGTAKAPAQENAGKTTDPGTAELQGMPEKPQEQMPGENGVGGRTEKAKPPAGRLFSEKQTTPASENPATAAEARKGSASRASNNKKNAAGSDPALPRFQEKASAFTPENTPDEMPELPAPPAAPADENSLPEKSRQVAWVHLDQLPLPFPPLALPPPGLEPLPLAPPPAAAPERLRTWRWQLGVAAGGGTALGHLEHERTGFDAGLSARLHRRGKPWSFNTDLVWRFRPGKLADTALSSVEQLKYSFGYTLERTEQRITGTHWLEWPLYLQYHLNVVNVEAGFMPSLMLFVQGRQERTQQTSLAPEPIVLERPRIRLENRWFARLHAGAFAGVAWQPTGQLSLGLRMHYQPGRIRTGSDIDLPKRSPVWWDLRVRCLFGKK